MPDTENHTNGIPGRLRTTTVTRNAVGAHPAITANRTYEDARDHATMNIRSKHHTIIKKHPSEVVNFEVFGDKITKGGNIGVAASWRP